MVTLSPKSFDSIISNGFNLMDHHNLPNLVPGIGKGSVPITFEGYLIPHQFFITINLRPHTALIAVVPGDIDLTGSVGIRQLGQVEAWPFCPDFIVLLQVESAKR